MNFKILLIFSLFSIVDLIFCAKPTNCKCRILTNSRIINGRPAKNHSYPWLVSIQLKNLKTTAVSSGVPSVLHKHGCAATIINDEWLMTAAHCVKPDQRVRNPESDLVIYYGDSNDLEKMTKRVDIKRIIRHDKFEEGFLTEENDIALIQLKGKITFSQNVQPACLGTAKLEQYPGVLNIAGWGSQNPITLNPKTGEVDATPISTGKLFEGDVFDQTKMHPACKNKGDRIICAHNPMKLTNSCKGDSGGPLMANIVNGKTHVIGITSFAPFRILPDKKLKICDNGAAYTRLSNYINFIQEYIGLSYCT